MTKPDLYQLFAFPTEKSKQLEYISTHVLVLEYPGIVHMSSYPVISHLFLFNFGISRDRLGYIIKTGISQFMSGYPMIYVGISHDM